MLGVRTWFAKCSLTGPGPRRSASLRRKRWTRQSALHLSPAPGLAQPNPGSRGARLPRWKTRGVVDERRSHFGRTPPGGKTAVAQQRGRRPPPILAARDSPSRWRGRPRVGSSTGPPVRRRYADDTPKRAFNRNLAKMLFGGKTAVARQRGRRPPQILAARGSPARWRGRWRVGLHIACELFARQTPCAAKRRTPGPRTPGPTLRGVCITHAKKGGEGGVCDSQVFCASKMPTFLARWRVRGRPRSRLLDGPPARHVPRRCGVGNPASPRDGRRPQLPPHGTIPQRGTVPRRCGVGPRIAQGP